MRLVGLSASGGRLRDACTDGVIGTLSDLREPATVRRGAVYWTCADA